jgi:hypothetical protein
VSRHLIDTAKRFFCLGFPVAAPIFGCDTRSDAQQPALPWVMTHPFSVNWKQLRLELLRRQTR